MPKTDVQADLSFAGCRCHLVGFAMSWLIYCFEISLDYITIILSPAYSTCFSKVLLWIQDSVLNTMLQGLTNPLSGCPRQVKNFAGQVKCFHTCPEKCMRYIGKTTEIQYFVAEVLYPTSRSNFDLSSPDVVR